MFITLEGIEGSGKTSQIRHIRAFFEDLGRRCTVTREPGGTGIGEQIRAVLLDPESRDLSPGAELLLYTADRVQHAAEVIRPALTMGHVVICDRYFDATLAYQGYARGLDMALIRALHRLMLDDLTPDLTLLLDLSPDQGLARAWHQIDNGTRAGDETRFEREALKFHEKVRAGYLDLAKQAPHRYRIIDAARSEDDVRQAVRDILSAHPGLGSSDP
ncbi:MAG: dTMP kinase [Desulfobacterales bacterium]|nr:dTMP kinase [Desulfobacterales bacterium]